MTTDAAVLFIMLHLTNFKLQFAYLPNRKRFTYPYWKHDFTVEFQTRILNKDEMSYLHFSMYSLFCLRDMGFWKAEIEKDLDYLSFAQFLRLRAIKALPLVNI